jgi:RNA polymerase sigma factor (sigma-70 family)
VPPASEVDTDALAAEPEPSDREASFEALDAAIETLPVIEREVLTLFYLRDLSLAEIADALSVPVGTVKSRLFRARRMARTVMQKEAES